MDNTWTKAEYNAAYTGAIAAARAGKQVVLEFATELGMPVVIVPVSAFYLRRIGNEFILEAPEIEIVCPGTISRVSIRDSDTVWLAGSAGQETFALSCYAFDKGERLQPWITNPWNSSPKFAQMVADVAFVYLEKGEAQSC